MGFESANKWARDLCQFCMDKLDLCSLLVPSLAWFLFDKSVFACLTLVGHPCLSSICSWNVGSAAIWFFFYKPHGRCKCVSAEKVKYLVYDSYKIYAPIVYTWKVYTLIFTYIILLLIDVLCYCVVSIYSTVRTAVPCCLFHTTAHHELPTMSIGKLAWTLYSKLDSKNRASELAKHSGLPSTPAPRTTQCYFPRPLLYLRRAVGIAERSKDRKIVCVPCALRFFRARVGAWARSREWVCVLKCSSICRTVQYRDKQSRQWV